MVVHYVLSFLLLILVYTVESKTYHIGDTIPLLYTKIFSYETQLSYTYTSLPFICPPYTHNNWQQKPLERTWLSLDQDLVGDRPVKSDYKIKVLENIECEKLCTREWSVSDAMKASELIQKDYQVEWWLDDIPGATASYTNEISTRVYRVGYPLGKIMDKNVYINNHITFNILYAPHESDSSKIDILGLEIYPESVKSDECQPKTIDHEMQQVTDRRTSLAFTYSVKWKQTTPLTLQYPWDVFLIPPNKDITFIASINMLIMTVLLTLVIGVILLKTVKKDITISHDDIHDDFEDVIGWRLIHRDVFRRPIYGGLLAPIIGSGLSLLIIGFIILGGMYNGWVHPAKHGALISLFIKLYIPGSFIAGYWSARIYKVFKGKSWTFNAVMTSLILPGFIFICLFVQNFFVWSAQSSLAISIRSWVTLVLLWLFLVVPFTMLGAFFGEKKDRIEHPVRTTQMPRFIPLKRWYQHYNVSIILGGIIPFAVIFVDLNEFLKSWHGELYMVIPHFVSTCVVLMIITAEVTTILIFFQLCSEDYHWWWMSFIIGGSSSLYVFLYGIIYYMTKTNIQGFYGGVIYIFHLILYSGFLCFATGSLGFFSAYWMIRRIYSTTKMD
ncbi:hypothetical protein BJ944DRAFT_259744 [Cunninghamella echinulata]|nr:hypothetical protein BJ944DRAFT_259744 [Cunninghamella echinulata]